MLKRTLTFLIPICIGSLIIAGVLQLILGAKPADYHYGGGTVIYSDSRYSDNSDVYYPAQDYIVLHNGEFKESFFSVYDSLTFKLSGVNVVINCSDDDNSKRGAVSVKNENSETGTYVSFYVKGDETIVEIHPSDITFDEQETEKINWTDDAFSTDIKSTVIISLPAKEYKNLVLEQGSGIVNINGINAQNSDITLCSGRLSFIGSKDYSPESIKLKTGSGKATFENVHAKSCDLDLGSGSADISGLMGKGTANIDGGTATMSFDSFSYMDISKDSGTLNLLLPPQTPAGIHAELKAGTINVNIDNSAAKITESGYYAVGSEISSNLIKVQNNGGDIYITNHAANIPENDPENNSEINSISD